MEAAMMAYGVVFVGFMAKAAYNGEISRHVKGAMQQSIHGGH